MSMKLNHQIKFYDAFTNTVWLCWPSLASSVTCDVFIGPLKHLCFTLYANRPLLTAAVLTYHVSKTSGVMNNLPAKILNLNSGHGKSCWLLLNISLLALS